MKVWMTCFAVVLAAISAAQAKDFELAEGFTVVEASDTYKRVLTPYATYPVMMEEYEQTVLFEIHGGTGPGQFTWDAINQNGEVGPESFAINSKNEIYILDTGNNRIQKFDYHGNYISSIPVYSFCDSTGKIPERHSSGDSVKPYYLGQTIVIDSRDNLYYYSHKGEGGFLWKFDSNDVLVSSMTAPFSYGMMINNSDDILVADQRMIVGTVIPAEYNANTFSFKKDKYYYTQVEGKNKEIRIDISQEPGTKPERSLLVFPVKKLSEKEKIFLDISRPADFSILRDGTYLTHCNHGYSDSNGPIAMRFDHSGRLLSIGYKAWGGIIDKFNGAILMIDTANEPTRIISNHAKQK